MEREAFAAYLANATAGNAAAQFQTALGYRTGRGVEKDRVRAVLWYQKAADQGLARAQSDLAEMYEYGLGTPQNYQNAITWYRKAAEQGHFPAQAGLAEMYSSGKVPVDLVAAYMWARLAVFSAHTEVLRDIGLGDSVLREFAELSDKIRAKMTPDQVSRARAMTRDWIKPFNRRMVALGEASAAQAVQKSRDDERRQSYGAAAEWYIKAADLGDVKAQFNLARLYSSGDLTPKLEIAHAWASIAATLAHSGARAEQGLPTDFESQCASLRTKISAQMDAGALAHAAARSRAWMEEFNQRER